MATAITPDLMQAGAASFLDAVKRRRSIRKLTGGPLSEETIRTILEAGRWSPSSGNTQPARMVVLRERHVALWDFIEAALADKLPADSYERAKNRISGYRPGLFSIVFYEDTTVANNPPQGSNLETWRSFATQAMGMTQINVWNAIAAAGLAASNQHVNLQIEEELRAFLGVPDTWKSYSIFPVGYADETPADKGRLPHEQVIFYEQGPLTTSSSLGEGK